MKKQIESFVPVRFFSQTRKIRAEKRSLFVINEHLNTNLTPYEGKRLLVQSSQTGFSLIELAVVLLIMGLLIGGLLGPLSGRNQTQRVEETQDHMQAIKEALIGYAIRHGRLPCPDTDPVDSRDGLENNTAPNLRCDHPTGITASPSLAEQRMIVTGFLPYQELGVGRFDPAGNPYIYSVSLSYADWAGNTPASGYDDPTPFPELTSTSNPPPSNACAKARADLAPRPTFTMCSKGGMRVLTEAGNESSLIHDDLPFMVVSQGFNSNAAGNANEQENADGDRTFVYRPVNSNDNFDDVLMWVPAPVLGLALVNAGQLP